MTTDDIIALANTDRVGDGLDMNVVLRTDVMMDVWSALGEARWKRITTTLTLSAAARQEDLPDDFDRMIEVHIPSPDTDLLSEATKLAYIGDNPSLILKAEHSTEPARPGAFWIAQRAASPNEWKAIRFSAIADEEYTVYYTYERFPHFTDMGTPFEMDQYMPRRLQSGLVKRLRMWILMDRFGQQDPRYDRVSAEYDRWLADAIDYGLDQARKNRQVYV